MNVLPFLTTRPQTKRELADRMGIPAREVEDLIRSERLAGAPILSNGEGYRITRDPKEVAKMAARMHRRASHVHETAEALAATADLMAREEAGIRSGTLGL